MCEPTTAIAIGSGVLSTASGIAGTMGQAQQQNAQAEAQYAANKNQRQSIINNQRSKLLLDSTAYYNRGADRKAADLAADRGANDAYLANQTKYNDKVKAFMSSKQNRMIKSLETAGAIGASSTRGGSNAQMQVANKAALGRDTAMGMANLRSAASKMLVDNKAIQGQLQGSYMDNFSKIGAIPTAGFTPPPVVKGPGANSLSIMAGIGSAVAGGLSSFGQANTLPNGQGLEDLGGGGGVPAPVVAPTTYQAPVLAQPRLTGLNYGG